MIIQKGEEETGCSYYCFVPSSEGPRWAGAWIGPDGVTIVAIWSLGWQDGIVERRLSAPVGCYGLWNSKLELKARRVVGGS